MKKLKKMATIYSCRCSSAGDWNRKCDGVSHPSTPDQAVTKKLQWCKRSGWIDRFFGLANWKGSLPARNSMSILMEPRGCSRFLVNVGDQVTAGQPIVRTAVRRPKQLTMQYRSCCQ